MKDPTEPFRFSFPDLDGKIVSNTDPRFQGKVVIVTIGGSWCPNCHDEAPFLVDLYKKYKSRGSRSSSSRSKRKRSRRTRCASAPSTRSYGIEYTVLIPGEPKELNEKVPQGVNLNSFPTTFFLGRDGRVRSAHAGFAGKASGKFHTELIEEETALVERLLAEKPAQTSAGEVIDPGTRIGAVHLTISDLRRSVRFYETHLGFQVHRRDDRTAWLGIPSTGVRTGGADDLLILSQCETAPRVRGTTGLYHFAILVPSRLDLAHALPAVGRDRHRNAGRRGSRGQRGAVSGR